jgi:hypothetical protein
MSLFVRSATESERADKVDGPLRRAVLIIMRLRRLVLISSKGLLDPPARALPRARVRRAWSTLAKIATERS